MLAALRWAVAALIAAHGLVHLTVFPGADAYGGGRLGWDGTTWFVEGTGTLAVGRTLVVLTAVTHVLAGLAIVSRPARRRAARILVVACALSAATFTVVWPGLTPEPASFWRGPVVTASVALLVPVLGAAFRPADGFAGTWLGRSFAATWRTTPGERAWAYRPEAYLPGANCVLWRAVDVDAPAEVVEAWVHQLRVAPYSWDLLDNRGRRSPRDRDIAGPPARVGEPILSVFHVAAVEPGVGLTMVGQGPPPTALTYDVRATSPTSSRLVVLASAVTASMLGAVVLAVCDLVMMTKQLRTLKRYAEREASATAGTTCLPSR